MASPESAARNARRPKRARAGDESGCLNPEDHDHIPDARDVKPDARWARRSASSSPCRRFRADGRADRQAGGDAEAREAERDHLYGLRGPRGRAWRTSPSSGARAESCHRPRPRHGHPVAGRPDRETERFPGSRIKAMLREVALSVQGPGNPPRARRRRSSPPCSRRRSRKSEWHRRDQEHRPRGRVPRHSRGDRP